MVEYAHPSKKARVILFVTHDLQEAVYLGQRISIFSSVPNAHIAAQVDVPFDYPRRAGDSEVASFTHEVHLRLDEAINAHGDGRVDKSA